MYGMTNEHMEGRREAPFLLQVVDRRTCKPESPMRRILFMDDDPVRYTELLARTEGRTDVTYVWAKDTAEAIHLLETEKWSAVMLDHDLCEEHYRAFGEGRAPDPSSPPTGMAVAQWLAERCQRFASMPIAVHTLNEPAGLTMTKVMRRAGLAANYAPWAWMRV